MSWTLTQVKCSFWNTSIIGKQNSYGCVPHCMKKQQERCCKGHIRTYGLGIGDWPCTLICAGGGSRKSIFSYHRFWPLAVLQLLEPQGCCTVSNLKILTIFEWCVVSSQGRISTFRVWYLLLKYPHLWSAYLVALLRPHVLDCCFKI